ncbi:TetR/AcrR family transcriptional regulator [Phytohabitans suffuscus]|uniref:TetR family transcriptional regulator n=1 Tax=Phytohabitans suffuscus TaxID=624315 RepID=A0A6F8YQ14_9ACTN|nr:TetR/AcrR family transcriptional regulator [Phytohabitans suffuscus]BCB88227.1 TetR family transcriptional regulator [Phytohabitans suffuscus]
MAEGRRRDAAATRSAILASARRSFARSGYDGAGVREIAEGAGVTAMMVNRYFGSKERLLAAVVADIMAEPSILTAANLEAPDFAARMAAILVDITRAGTTPLDGFLIMLHSASSERAAEIGREQIEAHYHRTLTAALDGDLSAERAGLLLAIVAGVQVMRQMIGLPALAHADPDVLRELLEPIFEQLLKPKDS